ncbi:MAG TPA: sigma-70 family RNA polymerase sigma factor [Gemmataceae bacterium]|nr:sigma-70 family RNA polymerase sigma factor [Gemmataceae bacterium]
MLRPWWRTLTRKMLPRRDLPATPPSGRRRRVRLHCEMLEDRVLMYAPNLEHLQLLPSAPAGEQATFVIVHSQSEPDEIYVVYDGVRSGEYSGAGWDQLLADLRATTPPSAQGPSSQFHQWPETPQLQNNPGNSKPPSGAPRPDGGAGRPGTDVPPRGDRDLSARAVPAQTTEPPAGGPAVSPPARGDIAAAPAAPALRSFDDGGATAVRPNPGPVGAAATEVVAEVRTVEPTEPAASRVEQHRAAGDVSDGLLLQRFVVDREQAAFTALVRRHELFVLGVCERVLGDSHAARDAVQQTFLVLARKAGVLDREGPLAGWLWTVASRQALRLRAMIARRRRKEKQAADDRPPHDAGVSNAPEEQEVREALRQELQRLPEKFRAPLVLCYFNGHTHEEAARALGIPRGSMAKRIGEALERLRERLRARGFTP